MFSDKKPSKYVILGTLLLLILLGLLIFFGIHAQAKDVAATKQEAGVTASDKRFIPIKDVKTPGGLTVWLAENHTLPIIAVRYYFLESGSALDPDDRQGLARMLSNTMDEGAGDMDSQTFQKALSDNSITLAFNAGRDGFGGQIQTLKRSEGKAFDLLALAINAPRFNDEPVARMRDGNIARINQSLSEPDWMAARLINDKAFAGHAYAKNSGGTLSGLGRITADDLRTFKTKNLTKDRLIIVASGDIKPDEISAAMDKVFAKLPEKAADEIPAKVTIQNPGKVYLYDQNIPQTMIEIMLPAFGHDDKDFYALQVLNYIYGGAGFGSRLMEEAREKRGLTYGVYSGINNYRHTDALSISTSTKTESTAEMLEIIKNEMVKLQNEKVGDKELADAKSYITGSMPLSLTSTDDVAEVILGLRAQGLPIDYLDHFADNIRAVTADDVQRVAKRVLKPEAMVTVLVGKPANISTAQKVEKLPNVQ